MTSLRGSQWIKPSFFVLAAVVACAAAACGGDNSGSRKTATKAVGGKAGASSTTTNNKGGATSSSKAPDEDGGTSSAETEQGGGGAAEEGGAPGLGGEGGKTTQDTTPSAAGAAGGPTTLPDITCASDITCKDAGLLCDLTAKKCVQCRKASDCDDGVACVGGVCGGTIPSGCRADTECASSTSGKVCDVTRGRCVACKVAKDCPNPEKSECVNNACVAIATCEANQDCSGKLLCDDSTKPGRCVECLGDNDCVALNQGNDTCVKNVCHKKCSGSDCSGGLKCNTSASPNYCAECATNSDCSADKYCSKGACVPDFCVAGKEQACVDDAVAVCSSDGDKFAAPTTKCSGGQTCLVKDGKASCGQGPVVVVPDTPLKPTACETEPAQAKPCTTIPKFTGTQTLDGTGADFCSVPWFELSFKTAETFYLENDGKAKSASSYTARAIAQVAWSPEAFHAFIEVFGSGRSNSTVEKIWDGDGIELMVTTSNTLTGLTSADANALHLILNKSLGVTVKSDGTNGAHTAIPTGQFAAKDTAKGYAVEVMIPWPSGSTLASSTQVRFDMALNVDVVAIDTNPGRDAQAVLAVAKLEGGQKSSCGGTAKPFCDDRLWCPTVLE